MESKNHLAPSKVTMKKMTLIQVHILHQKKTFNRDKTHKD